MIKYQEWLLKEGQVKMYELYITGPGIAPVEHKVVTAVKGVIQNPKSFMVLKFRGTKEELSKAERALEGAGFRVIDSEIEHA